MSKKLLEAVEDRLMDLALYLNHKIVLTKGQRRRAKARAAGLIAERRATRDRGEG